MKNLLVYVPLTWPNISSEVFKSFLDMISPKVQEELKAKYDVQINTLIHKKFPLDLNRNDAVERALTQYKADFIMFCDADQVFPRNSLLFLMENVSRETPVVTGMAYRKTPPHHCIVGHYLSRSEHIDKSWHSLFSRGLITNDGQQCLFYEPAAYVGQDVPFQVDVFGMGCVMVDAEVFKSLKQPYFKYMDGYSSGDHTLDPSSEEMWFCASLKKAGIKILCDPRVQCGHITEKVVTFQDNNITPRPKIKIFNPTIAEAL